jgi:hypothetical protein
VYHLFLTNFSAINLNSFSVTHESLIILTKYGNIEQARIFIAILINYLSSNFISLSFFLLAYRTSAAFCRKRFLIFNRFSSYSSGNFTGIDLNYTSDKFTHLISGFYSVSDIFLITNFSIITRKRSNIPFIKSSEICIFRSNLIILSKSLYRIL